MLLLRWAVLWGHWLWPCCLPSPPDKDAELCPPVPPFPCCVGHPRNSNFRDSGTFVVLLAPNLGRESITPSPQSHKDFGRAGAPWTCPCPRTLEILELSKPKYKQDFYKTLLYTILGQSGQTGDTTSCLEMLAPSPQQLQVSEGLCSHKKFP